MELTKGILEVGKGALRLFDVSIVAAEDFLVCRSMAEVLACLEHLALCLDAPVDVLDLLVQLVSL